MAADLLARAFLEIRALSGDLKSDLGQIEGQVKSSTNRMQDMVMRVAGSLAGLMGGGSMLGFGLKLAADAERSEVAFNVILKDMEKTKSLLAELDRFSVTTPFTPVEVKQSAQAMLAFRHSVEDLPRFLQMLGDASAGTGADLNELTRIFNKVKAQGKLTGETFEQFAERGVNVQAELADMLGKTGDEIVEMRGRGEISFDMIVQALERMTGKGGMFFQAMAKQSTTVWGLWSTLVGVVQELAKGLGNELMGGAKLALNNIIQLGFGLLELNKATDGFVGKAAAATSAALVLAGALGTLRLAGVSLSQAFKMAMISTGLGAVLVVVGSIIAAIVQLVQWIAQSDEFTKRWEQSSQTLNHIWDALRDLFAAVWEQFKTVAGGALQFIEQTFGVSFGNMQDDLGAWAGEALQKFLGFVLDAVEWLTVLVENNDRAWEIMKQAVVVAVSFWLDQFLHMREAWPQMIGFAIRQVVSIVLEGIKLMLQAFTSFMDSVVKMAAKMPDLIAAALKGNLGDVLGEMLVEGLDAAFAPARGFLKGLSGEMPSLIADPSGRTMKQYEKLSRMFDDLKDQKFALEAMRAEKVAAAEGGAPEVGAKAKGEAAAAVKLEFPDFLKFGDIQKTIQQQMFKQDSDEKKTAENTDKLVKIGEAQKQVQEQLLAEAKKEGGAVATK